MPFFDLPLAQLKQYKPEIREPLDFEDFWCESLAQNPALEEPLEIVSAAPHLTSLDVKDLTIQGYGAQPVKGWYIRPRGVTHALPTIVSFIGYGGGRGFPEEHTSWAAAGFAEVVVDSRSQGAAWTGGGDTADVATIAPAVPGCMTRGIAHPNDYYYRRLFIDAANAIVTARGLEGVDSTRIAAVGGSQGAGIALAATALDTLRGGDHQVFATVADVPFLSHFERAIGLTGEYPYQEVADYLATKRDMVETIFDTLSYFDVANFAKRINNPALFSVGLADPIAPPSTVYAAYNWCAGPAEIEVYPYNGHAGGGVFQLRREIEWLQGLANSTN